MSDCLDDGALDGGSRRVGEPGNDHVSIVISLTRDGEKDGDADERGSSKLHQRSHVTLGGLTEEL